MEKVTEVNGVKKVVTAGEISVARVYEAQYQKKGTLTAELKQTILTTTTYPSQSVSNSMQDSLFGTEDFGFEEGESYNNKEVRVTWVPVPTSSTPEQVQERLDQSKDAVIYRVLSNTPIINDAQANAISRSDIDLSLDDIADSQAVRFPKGHEDEGKLALDSKGRVQYRAVFFSKAPKEDLDHRSEDAKTYVSPKLEAELNAMETGEFVVVNQEQL